MTGLPVGGDTAEAAELVAPDEADPPALLAPAAELVGPDEAVPPALLAGPGDEAAPEVFAAVPEPVDPGVPDPVLLLHEARVRTRAVMAAPAAAPRVDLRPARSAILRRRPVIALPPPVPTHSVLAIASASSL